MPTVSGGWDVTAAVAVLALAAPTESPFATFLACRRLARGRSSLRGIRTEWKTLYEHPDDDDDKDRETLVPSSRRDPDDTPTPARDRSRFVSRSASALTSALASACMSIRATSRSSSPTSPVPSTFPERKALRGSKRSVRRGRGAGRWIQRCTRARPCRIRTGLS